MNIIKCMVNIVVKTLSLFKKLYHRFWPDSVTNDATTIIITEIILLDLDYT